MPMDYLRLRALHLHIQAKWCTVVGSLAWLAKLLHCGRDIARWLAHTAAFHVENHRLVARFIQAKVALAAVRAT